VGYRLLAVSSGSIKLQAASKGPVPVDQEERHKPTFS